MRIQSTAYYCVLIYVIQLIDIFSIERVVYTVDTKQTINLTIINIAIKIKRKSAMENNDRRKNKNNEKTTWIGEIITEEHSANIAREISARQSAQIDEFFDFNCAEIRNRCETVLARTHEFKMFLNIEVSKEREDEMGNEGTREGEGRLLERIKDLSAMLERDFEFIESCEMTLVNVERRVRQIEALKWELEKKNLRVGVESKANEIKESFQSLLSNFGFLSAAAGGGGGGGRSTTDCSEEEDRSTTSYTREVNTNTEQSGYYFGEEEDLVSDADGRSALDTNTAEKNETTFFSSLFSSLAK